MEPLQLEDFLSGSGALGDDSRLPGECSLKYGEKGNLAKSLDRALKKHGLAKTQSDLKNAMFGGARKKDEPSDVECEGK